MVKQAKKEKFDIKKSSIKKAYILLDAKNPEELFNNYLSEDQRLVKRGELEYESPKLKTTKIKNILEKLDVSKLLNEEIECRQNILWLWYHHAISYAVWHYKDKKKANNYSYKALKYQRKDHSNKITRLLYLLIRDKLKEAEDWTNTIRQRSEKKTALDLIKFYKDGGFFK